MGIFTNTPSTQKWTSPTVQDVMSMLGMVEDKLTKDDEQWLRIAMSVADQQAAYAAFQKEASALPEAERPKSFAHWKRGDYGKKAAAPATPLNPPKQDGAGPTDEEKGNKNAPTGEPWLRNYLNQLGLANSNPDATSFNNDLSSISMTQLLTMLDDPKVQEKHGVAILQEIKRRSGFERQPVEAQEDRITEDVGNLDGFENIADTNIELSMGRTNAADEVFGKDVNSNLDSVSSTVDLSKSLIGGSRALTSAEIADGVTNFKVGYLTTNELKSIIDDSSVNSDYKIVAKRELNKRKQLQSMNDPKIQLMLNLLDDSKTPLESKIGLSDVLEQIDVDNIDNIKESPSITKSAVWGGINELPLIDDKWKRKLFNIVFSEDPGPNELENTHNQLASQLGSIGAWMAMISAAAIAIDKGTPGAQNLGRWVATKGAALAAAGSKALESTSDKVSYSMTSYFDKVSDGIRFFNDTLATGKTYSHLQGAPQAIKEQFVRAAMGGEFGWNPSLAILRKQANHLYNIFLSK